MKEYKYKINGNVYKVAIGDIEDNIAHVEVNGTPYKVEMEKAPKVVVKPVARPAATSAPAAPATPVVKPAAASTGKSGVKSPLPGVILDIKAEKSVMAPIPRNMSGGYQPEVTPWYRILSTEPSS